MFIGEGVSFFASAKPLLNSIPLKSKPILGENRILHKSLQDRTQILMRYFYILWLHHLLCITSMNSKIIIHHEMIKSDQIKNQKN